MESSSSTAKPLACCSSRNTARPPTNAITIFGDHMTAHIPGYDVLSSGLAEVAELAPMGEDRVRVGRVYDGDRLRVRTLAIPAGVTLAEHIAGAPVLIHVIAGRVRVDIGGNSHELTAGALVRADPEERHEVFAHEDARLMLTFHP